MNYLVTDCKEIVELSDSKRRKLDLLSDKMRDMVTTLKKETEKRLKEVSDDFNMSKDRDASKYAALQVRES